MRLYRFGVLLIFFFIPFLTIQAQYGIRAKYNSNNYANWENAINNRFGTKEKLYASSYELGVDYWFRLKERRIEFMPELSYTIGTTKYNDDYLQKMEYNAINFNFHTQIYALDLEGDCNCPTFSKQGPSINKGLFFHLTPGVSYHTSKASTNPLSSLALEQSINKDVVFKVGVGIGLDLGVSDFLTLTPIVSYYFNSNMGWDKIAVTSDPFVLQDSKVNVSQLQFTLRVGFRADYGKSRYR